MTLELRDPQVRAELFAMRWASESAAKQWLRRQGANAEALTTNGLIVGMAPDNGVCLQEQVTAVKGTIPQAAKAKERSAATRRALELDAATGKGKVADIDDKVAAHEKADAAGDIEDARPKVPQTLVDGDTPLPDTESLLARDTSGRVMINRSHEAFIRLPTMGPKDKLRSWAAYYAAYLRTVIDVCDVETGALIERFNGRGATVRPPSTSKPRVSMTNGTGRGRRASSAALSPLQLKWIELASRPDGAKRTELTSANEGTVLNWKGVLESLGKKRGLSLTVTKAQGETPVYKLA
jgi:hypothetical protein